MKVAVINSGSSSIKFQLFQMPQGKMLAHLLVEKIGEPISDTILEYDDKEIILTCEIKDHHEGLEKIITLLKEYDIFEDFATLDAIGHRVVHGGEEFHDATLINEHVIEKIEELIPLAPLHNPANLEGILVAKKKAPLVPQVAVFDTSFHANMPKESFIYALPYEMYKKYQIRRYGFHGTSYKYLLDEAANILDKKQDDLNLIMLHLGNGASACALKNGVSIDTSMGFTPLEGLVMGSRSGDIDPAIAIFMQRELGKSVDEVDKILNKRSGLLGICGENDVREILEDESENAKLALDIMIHRIKKYIGAYAALLGRVDGVVFSGGIGEHSEIVREKAMKNLPFEVKTMVIATNEELQIAKESLTFIR